jgi:ketopantoate reductase
MMDSFTTRVIELLSIEYFELAREQYDALLQCSNQKLSQDDVDAIDLRQRRIEEIWPILEGHGVRVEVEHAEHKRAVALWLSDISSARTARNRAYSPVGAPAGSAAW